MSSDHAIRVHDIRKSYRLSHADPHTGLRELVYERFRHPLRRAPVDVFHALGGVSFDVSPGEVLGIIGPNGAGKSTLLKVLARITQPDSGTAVVRGRLGSLLEVGTGFHPELTGRENVYLNGAILGMTRREITGAFDEIVDFADVERFLDTPVKRYSSGMYVRLAFAVAAHLRAEILVVDEVLAVGDVSFQQRCLDKMSEVAGQQGRTILFISHNMAAIQTLCRRTLVLASGLVAFDGSTDAAVSAYLAAGQGETGQHDTPGVWEHRDRQNTYGDALHVHRVRLKSRVGAYVDRIRCGDPLIVELTLSGLRHGVGADQVAVQVTTELAVPVFNVNTAMTSPTSGSTRGAVEVATVTIDCVPVTPGEYWITVAVIEGQGGEVRDMIMHAARFSVLATDIYESGYELSKKDGLVFVDASWSFSPAPLARALEG